MVLTRDSPNWDGIVRAVHGTYVPYTVIRAAVFGSVLTVCGKLRYSPLSQTPTQNSAMGLAQAQRGYR